MHKVLALVTTRAGFASATNALMLLAFFLRAWHLGDYDLWVDEGISYYIANFSPIEIIAYTARNVSEHPPGYYFALHFWMQLTGSSEFTLRFFSVVGGMLYLALLIMLVRRWFGRPLALLVGALFCVQPLAVMLSRDTRMYTWYGVAVLLVVYLFDRAIHRQGIHHWLSFALAALVSVAFNYLSVLVLLALAMFATVNWRTLGRRVLPFALVVFVLFVAPLVWIVASPGPRGSMGVLFDALRMPWSPARMVNLYFGWPLGGAADNGQTFGLWILAAIRWLLAIIGIVWAVPPRHWPRHTFQWLLALLIFIPPLVASLVFPVVKQRFFFATLGFFVLAVTLGITACWRRFRPLGAVVAGVLLGALLLMDGQAALAQLGNRWRPFTVPINFIMDRARQGETIVYTYLWERFQDLYYNRGRLPVDFVPPEEAPVTVQEAERSALKALAPVGSAWLVIYPSDLKPEVVEQGFNSAGYPGEKTWFPGSRGVVRYFSEQPVAEQPGGMIWADHIRLNRWWTSTMQVAAGDALRLQFEWQDLAPPDGLSDGDRPSELIELSLVGADGQLWAARVGGPCNGLCPLQNWDGKPVQERQAFYIPRDTPPGKYEVRLRWLTPAGEPMLVRRPEDPSRQAYLKLFDAEVLPPLNGLVSEASLGHALGALTDDGKLTLVSLAPAFAPALPGSSLTVPMQWRVAAPVGALEARLILVRNGQETVQAAPLGPEWYTSDAWTSGRLIRTQPSFAIPATLQPGDYEMALAVGPPDSSESVLRLPVGTFSVRDRERRFDLPATGETVSVDWQEGIHLARVDAPSEVKAGESMSVTLVWQAGRPTGGNWKVFVHLADAEGTVKGQGDSYPVQGSALTPTWKAGEVIVDEHRIELPKDLAPGDYRLRIGFYNESTDERLPLAPGVDTYVWPDPVSIKQP